MINREWCARAFRAEQRPEPERDMFKRCSDHFGLVSEIVEQHPVARPRGLGKGP